MTHSRFDFNNDCELRFYHLRGNETEKGKVDSVSIILSGMDNNGFTFIRLFTCLYFFTAGTGSLFAQKEDTVAYRVYYELTHIRDLDQPDSIYHEHMVLLCGVHSSMFVSYDKLNERVANRAYVYDQLLNSTDNSSHVSMARGKVVTPQEIIRSYDHSDLLILDYAGRVYAYEEKMEDIEWEIKADTKKILGFICHKASASLKGRLWEVWFTPEIVLSSGPWKLGGLPGLILAASDSTRSVSYEAVSVQSSTVPDDVFAEETAYNYVGLTDKARVAHINKADFEKLKENARVNLKAFMSFQIQAMHKKGGVLDYGLLNSDSWAKPIPNPIALTD